MDKRIAALLGGAAAVLTLGPAAQAAEPAAGAPSTVESYADLLAPIPNAVAQLKVDDARLAQEKPAKVELARYYHHHHHHHHNSFFGGIIGGPYYGGPYYGGPYYGGGCYWTWTRPYWNGYRWVRRHIRVCR